MTGAGCKFSSRESMVQRKKADTKAAVVCVALFRADVIVSACVCVCVGGTVPF